MTQFHSFWWRSNIPFYVYRNVVTEQRQQYMHRIVFIHSSADAHLGCFHVTASVSSIAVNTVVHVFFQDGFLKVYSQ